MGGFVFLPVFQSVLISFQDFKLARGTSSYPWIGLDNYKLLWEQGDLQHAFWITFSFMLMVVIIILVFSMILSLFFNQGKSSDRTMRSLILLSWGTPTVIVALLWSWMFQAQYGIINYVLLKLGLISESISFLAHPDTALGSVAVAAIWRQLPFMFLMLLSGLQGIPKEMYEAARIDGVNSVQSFFYITLPFLRNVIRASVLISIITSFKQFPLFWVMTGGGPMRSTETLAILTYRNAFVNMNFGIGAAVATSWLAALVLFSIIYNRVFKEASY